MSSTIFVSDSLRGNMQTGAIMPNNIVSNSSSGNIQTDAIMPNNIVSNSSSGNIQTDAIMPNNNVVLGITSLNSGNLSAGLTASCCYPRCHFDGTLHADDVFLRDMSHCAPTIDKAFERETFDNSNKPEASLKKIITKLLEKINALEQKVAELIEFSPGTGTAFKTAEHNFYTNAKISDERLNNKSDNDTGGLE